MNDSNPKEPIHKIEAGDDVAQGRDLAAENRVKLAELFPGLLTESTTADGQTIPAIDAEALRDLVGATVETESREKFGLSWHGKSAARRLALTPSTGTLRPCPGDDESVDWDTTKNVFIEGDNLEVLKLLQKSYAGRVKLTYLDPPYNTGNDFVYKDDYRDPLGRYEKYTGQRDEEGAALIDPKNRDSGGRFHTDWLNMIYPRLLLARELLREDGAIFVSINDNELHNLRCVMDHIFGAENFVANIVWQRSKKGDSKLVANVHEYVVCYTRSQQKAIEAGVWRVPKEGVEDVLSKYNELRIEYANEHEKIREEMQRWYKSLSKKDPRKAHKHYNWSDDRGLYFASDFAGPDDGRASRPRHDIIHPVTDKPCKKPSTGWRWDEARTEKALAENPPRIHFGPDHTTIPNRKSYLRDITSEPFSTVFYQDGRSATLQVEELVGKGEFSFPKNVEVLSSFIALTTKSDDIVLDFFAGSGSTGHAVMQQNAADGGSRRYVLVQLPEPTSSKKYKTICDITKKRLRGAGSRIKSEHKQWDGDTGFRVFKLDTANVKAWEAPTTDALEPGDINNLLEESVDGVKIDRSEEDLLWGAMLNLGLPLDGSIDQHDIEGMTVYAAGACTLLACFAKSIDRASGEALASGLAKLIKQSSVEGDVTVLLRDAAFDGDDAVKVNLVENLRQHAPDADQVRVLSI